LDAPDNLKAWMTIFLRGKAVARLGPDWDAVLSPPLGPTMQPSPSVMTAGPLTFPTWHSLFLLI